MFRGEREGQEETAVWGRQSCRQAGMLKDRAVNKQEDRLPGGQGGASKWL